MIGILYMVPAYFQDPRGMAVGQQKEEQGKLFFCLFAILLAAIYIGF